MSHDPTSTDASAESKPHTATAEQNWALLDFLAGIWSARATFYVHGDLGWNKGLCVTTRYGGIKARACYRSSPDGTLAGYYLPTSGNIGSQDQAPSTFIRLSLDPSRHGIVAVLSEDDTGPPIEGVWADSTLRFKDVFRDCYTTWELFTNRQPKITGHPSTISLIIRQASASCWLLDLAFAVQEVYASQENPVNLLCRLELWHSREQGEVATPPHFLDVDDALDDCLHRGDDATAEAEAKIDDIEDMISSLEESKDRLEEQIKLLKGCKDAAEGWKSDAESAGDDAVESIVTLHGALHAFSDPTSPAEAEKSLAAAWSALDDVRDEAETLASEIDSLSTDIELDDSEVAALFWTQGQYARGQELLRLKKGSLPAEDLSFLGQLEPATARLSKDALKLVKTAAALYLLAAQGQTGDVDFGPQIASMAKTCERILADVFERHRQTIADDPSVRSLLADPGSLEMDGSVQATVEPGDLKRVIGLIRKAAEAGKPIKWSGMENKRLALLLFGGWVVRRDAGSRQELNLLGVDRDLEFVRLLPERLGEFQSLRNGFVHHDVATTADLSRAWRCFQDCLKGLLQAFHGNEEAGRQDADAESLSGGG